ncbi:MAG TPA: permease, partial [Leptospiraceae bacterium]|nr:permease [Leptospiraceae bacterium]
KRMSPGFGYFLASIAGFSLGPLLVSFLSGRKHWKEWLDGFSIASVTGIVLVHLLPEAVSNGGFSAFVLISLSVLIPALIEKLFRGQKWFNIRTILVLGFFLHTLLESAALGTVSPEHSNHLGLAVVLHRLPVGIILFSHFQRAKGTRTALYLIASLIVCAAVGFLLGNGIEKWGNPSVSLGIEIFVSVSLLHIAFDRHHSISEIHEHHCSHDHCSHHHSVEEKHPVSIPGFLKKWDSALGAFSGIALVSLIMGSPNLLRQYPSNSLSFVDTFWTLALETAPALLLGYSIAGLVKSFLPESGLDWLRQGNSMLQSLKGVIFGLPIPVCSCGVLPIYESLIKKGVPAGAAIGFLIATPEIGLDAFLISIPLLGKDITFLRLIVAFAVAMLTAVLLGRLIPVHPSNAEKNPVSQEKKLSEKIRSGLEFGFIELFDHTMPWVFIGLLLAAVIEPVFNYEVFKQIPPWVQVPVFALIGLPLYVCATGATPLAAIAIHKGVSAGAMIAFLIAGPATNVTTFSILAKLHGRKTAAVFGIAAVSFCVLFGWAVNLIPLQIPGGLHSFSGENSHLLEKICLFVLGLLFISSVLRQGPRGFVNQIVSPIHSHK